MIAFITKLLFGPVQEINQSELKQLIKARKKVHLLDVRTPMEYREMQLSPSINIPLQGANFLEQLKNYNKQETYILYCKSGKRSAKAARKMTKAGFEHVFSLEGGVFNWEGNKRLK